MIAMEDIRAMDEESIGYFVREEAETIDDLEQIVTFAQQLREYAMDEREHRESGDVERDDD